jgi:hypothetical protein
MHAVLSLINIFVVLVAISKTRQTQCAGNLSALYCNSSHPWLMSRTKAHVRKAPASEAIRYQIETLDLGPGKFAANNAYVGDPRPALDHA